MVLGAGAPLGKPAGLGRGCKYASFGGDRSVLAELVCLLQTDEVLPNRRNQRCSVSFLDVHEERVLGNSPRPGLWNDRSYHPRESLAAVERPRPDLSKPVYDE